MLPASLHGHVLLACMCASLGMAALGCGDDEAGTDAGLDAGRDGGADAAREAGAPEDAAGADASLDASRFDAGRGPHDAQPPLDASDQDAGSVELTLADTGLYADPASETLAPSVQAFEPSFALFSDGASKKRYLYLPPGAQIDTSDMDHWQFPVGTKAWKEFTRDGVRVETRLLHKTAQGWYMMAFVWNAAQTEAVAAISGMQNANGTSHDVPSSGDCQSCHAGAADRLLGVSAIQLSHGKPGVTLAQLTADDRLTAPPAQSFSLPGTQIENDAFGMLHANCAHCHNPLGGAWGEAVGMDLELRTASLVSAQTMPAYTTTVGVALTSRAVPGATLRVAANEPTMSGLYLRLTAMRAAPKNALAMPPLATEEPDTDTEGKVSAWITSLP